MTIPIATSMQIPCRHVTALHITDLYVFRIPLGMCELVEFLCISQLYFWNLILGTSNIRRTSNFKQWTNMPSALFYLVASTKASGSLFINEFLPDPLLRFRFCLWNWYILMYSILLRNWLHCSFFIRSVISVFFQTAAAADTSCIHKLLNRTVL